jgi:hypothetical protein
MIISPFISDMAYQLTVCSDERSISEHEGKLIGAEGRGRRMTLSLRTFKHWMNGHMNI